MDSFFQALGESIAGAGPEYVTALGMLAIVAWVLKQAIPLYADHMNQKLEIDRDRERRKAAEEASRERRDRERSEMEGRWLSQYEKATQVQEQTNRVVEGVRAQMEVLNANLYDSKERSRQMSEEVHELHEALVQ